MHRILTQFNADSVEELNDVEALRKFCSNQLLKELQQDNRFTRTNQ
jgi:hypothetical protein